MLGEGQPWNVLDSGHGGPVPAKLTQTAKEVVMGGKRPAHIVTTRYPPLLMIAEVILV